jgi:hypothetical protein
MRTSSDCRPSPTPIILLAHALGDDDEMTVASRPARNLRTTRCVLEERIPALGPTSHRARDDSPMT